MNPPTTTYPMLNGQTLSRLPVGGKIRAGIKVLTKTASANEQAVEIYNRGVARDVKYDQIERKIRDTCQIKTPLVPKNTPYFKAHRHDFAQPEIADKILSDFGTDQGEGLELYRFPVVFPMANWQLIMPHSLKTYTSQQLKYWSEYGADGVRLCKTHADPELNQDKKAKRVFGGRRIILRPDNSGICDPLECPEYQSRQCNLTGAILFFIPGIPGTSLIELPTTSFYTMQAVRQQLEVVKHLRGKIWGTHQGRPIFYLTKQLREVSMINDDGKPQRVKQWIAVLESDIDMTGLFGQLEDRDLIASGREAVRRLENHQEMVAESGEETEDGEDSPF